MEPRANAWKLIPGGYKAMLGIHEYLTHCGIEEQLLHLVFLRASQLNGCAYCTDMHWKDARVSGFTEQKLSLLTAWRESPGFSERERAALDWTEAVTFLHEGHVEDLVYRTAREQFGEAELANLTLAVASINSWNRMAISFRTKAGSYQPQPAKAAVVS